MADLTHHIKRKSEKMALYHFAVRYTVENTQIMTSAAHAREEKKKMLHYWKGEHTVHVQARVSAGECPIRMGAQQNTINHKDERKVVLWIVNTSHKGVQTCTTYIIWENK